MINIKLIIMTKVEASTVTYNNLNPTILSTSHLLRLIPVTPFCLIN